MSNSALKLLKITSAICFGISLTAASSFLSHRFPGLDTRKRRRWLEWEEAAIKFGQYYSAIHFNRSGESTSFFLIDHETKASISSIARGYASWWYDRNILINFFKKQCFHFWLILWSWTTNVTSIECNVSFLQIELLL